MTADDLLLRYLAERDAACPICGYDVGGLTKPVCPECGEPLVLAVRPRSTRLAWWIVGLIAWAIGFGFFGVLLALLLPDNGLPPGSGSMFYLGTAASGVGLAAWLLLIRRLRRAGVMVRVPAAIASICLVIGLFVAFYIQVIA